MKWRIRLEVVTKGSHYCYFHSFLIFPDFTPFLRPLFYPIRWPTSNATRGSSTAQVKWRMWLEVITNCSHNSYSPSFNISGINALPPPTFFNWLVGQQVLQPKVHLLLQVTWRILLEVVTNASHYSYFPSFNFSIFNALPPPTFFNRFVGQQVLQRKVHLLRQ